MNLLLTDTDASIALFSSRTVSFLSAVSDCSAAQAGVSSKAGLTVTLVEMGTRGAASIFATNTRD